MNQFVAVVKIHEEGKKIKTAQGKVHIRWLKENKKREYRQLWESTVGRDREASGSFLFLFLFLFLFVFLFLPMVQLSPAK